MDKKIALVTGATGFVGSHLLDFLIRQNIHVVAFRRRRSDERNVRHLLNNPDITWAYGDIEDELSIAPLFQNIQLDYVFHLAALSFVGDSWLSPKKYIQTNTLGSLNILEAAHKYRKRVKILLAGSSEQFGQVLPIQCPLDEKTLCRPVSPYAMSKQAMCDLGYQYFKSYDTNIYISLASNHSGPRRGQEFATSSFARQIALIEAGKQDPIIVHGNLGARRDWTDVRDIVRGYWLIVNNGKPGQKYVLCSGRAYSVIEMLTMLMKMSIVKIELQQDPSLFRPSDIPMLVGTNEKARNYLHWNPEIPFEKTLSDLLNYWREEIKNGR